MGFWSKFGSAFKKLGNLAKSGLGYAAKAGLTDEVMRIALVWCKVAAKKSLDNDQKKRFVTDILTAKGVPTSIANLAIELAVQILKHGA